jgi:hypothetical protein
MKQSWLVAVGLLIVMTGFQNCSKTEFSSGEASSVSEKGALVELTAEEEAAGELDQLNQKEPKKSCRDRKQAQVQAGFESQQGLVACILNRSGKSLKLGYVESSLSGVTSVAQSVCISPAACLNIVSQAFQVEGVYDRGYCDHNPNVKRLTDAEVQSLVEKI